jgi:hypothetical protein
MGGMYTLSFATTLLLSLFSLAPLHVSLSLSVPIREIRGRHHASKFFSSKTSAKSHVKPQKHLTQASRTTYKWHFSYLQSRKIEPEIKQSPLAKSAWAFVIQKTGRAIVMKRRKNNP